MWSEIDVFGSDAQCLMLGPMTHVMAGATFNALIIELAAWHASLQTHNFLHFQIQATRFIILMAAGMADKYAK
jgi:hypothetical protein